MTAAGDTRIGEGALEVCNFCEQRYDPYDIHVCVGNSIRPRTRKPIEDEFSPSPTDTLGPFPSCAYPELGLTRQQIGEALDAERQKFYDNGDPEGYESHSGHLVAGYETLENVLRRAYLQAATGKGAARHGRGIRFDEQPTQAISRLLGTDAGLAFQAMKKINEGMRLDHAAKIKELLGAINYIASIIIHMEYDNGR